MGEIWLGTGTLGWDYVRQQKKEPVQVQWDTVRAPGVRPWHGGKAKKEVSIGASCSRQDTSQGRI